MNFEIGIILYNGGCVIVV